VLVVARHSFWEELLPRPAPGEEISVATNRKALHDYFVEDTLEAGIALTGTEIKSVRGHRVNLRDGFVQIKNGDAWLLNVHISPYDFGNRENHEPRRERRLLLHKQEIRKLLSKVSERGWTIVPLRMYIKEGRAKVEIALVRGKRLYDKRDAVAERDMDRELRRTVKEQDYD
jgi:SsrA-binding protein